MGQSVEILVASRSVSCVFFDSRLGCWGLGISASGEESRQRLGERLLDDVADCCLLILREGVGISRRACRRLTSDTPRDAADDCRQPSGRGGSIGCTFSRRANSFATLGESASSFLASDGMDDGSTTFFSFFVRFMFARLLSATGRHQESLGV
jgi:hypothetical protein